MNKNFLFLSEVCIFPLFIHQTALLYFYGVRELSRFKGYIFLILQMT